MCPSAWGSGPYNSVESRDRCLTFVMFQNQQDAIGWPNKLPERSSSSRSVRLRHGRDFSAFVCEHSQKFKDLERRNHVHCKSPVTNCAEIYCTEVKILKETQVRLS